VPRSRSRTTRLVGQPELAIFAAPRIGTAGAGVTFGIERQHQRIGGRDLGQQQGLGVERTMPLVLDRTAHIERIPIPEQERHRTAVVGTVPRTVRGARQLAVVVEPHPGQFGPIAERAVDDQFTLAAGQHQHLRHQHGIRSRPRVGRTWRLPEHRRRQQGHGRSQGDEAGDGRRWATR
jgi:hypothetical protein